MIIRILFILVLSAVICRPVAAEDAAVTKAWDDSPPTQITILAEESLSVPLSLIVRRYTSHNRVSVSLSLDSTAHQVGKIEEGEPADIFITANEEALRRLKLQGLLDAYTYISIAGNRMIIAVAASNPLTFTMKAGDDLLGYLPENPAPVFALVDENLYAEGIFAAEVLEKLGIHTGNDIMLPLPLAEPQPASVAILPKRREMIDMVAKGEAYGITYATDAGRLSGIRQAALLPESLHKPIKYIAVVVAGKEMVAARKFAEFLRSAEAQNIFLQHGFTPAR